RPREGCDVGDRIALSTEERHLGEPLLEHFKRAAHLRAVAIEGVVVTLRSKTHEVHVLAEHRPDEGHLHHHPLDVDEVNRALTHGGRGYILTSVEYGVAVAAL